MEDMNDWQPPTEAEMKVIQAKRERSDKISKLMGDYLLKGYKMLGTCCPICMTILLRDKTNKDYCVACSELDTEHAKDNPVLSEAAARSIVEEEGQRPQPEIPHINGPVNGAERGTSEAAAVKRKWESQSERPQRLQRKSGNSEPSFRVETVVGESIDVVCEKLAWAREELQSSNSIEISLKICELMKLCAETIVTLRKAGSTEL